MEVLVAIPLPNTSHITPCHTAPIVAMVHVEGYCVIVLFALLPAAADCLVQLQMAKKLRKQCVCTVCLSVCLCAHA